MSAMNLRKQFVFTSIPPFNLITKLYLKARKNSIDYLSFFDEQTVTGRIAPAGLCMDLDQPANAAAAAP